MGKEKSNNKKKDEAINVVLPFKEMPPRTLMNLHMDACSGENGKEKFRLCTGFGCGNMGMWFEYKGKRYSVNAATIVEQLIKQIDEKAV